MCADLPTAMSHGDNTVINGKVYFGGGNADDDSKHSMLCYDQAQDVWTTLPPLPVTYYGLGHINGKLVAVGGQKIPNLVHTNEMYKFKMKGKWQLTTPAMPTARSSPAVVSLSSALVVAGGENEQGEAMSSVSVLKHALQQWYRCDPLPKPCANLSPVLINDQVFMLGGHESPLSLNGAMYTSVDALLSSSEPCTEAADPTCPTQWKMLPDTPLHQPAAGAVLRKSLLSIGGKQSSSQESTAQQQVYIYSPTADSWIYISDLPCPMAATTTAVVSPVDILVIGGWDGQSLKTVVKGSLNPL